MARPQQNLVFQRDGRWNEIQTQIWPGGTDIRKSSGSAREVFRTLSRSASVSVPKDHTGWRHATQYGVERVAVIAHPSGYRKATYVNPFAFLGYMNLERFGLPSWLTSPYQPDFPLHLRNRAERKALLKLKDQKVDFSVMMGETRSTAKMFAENAQKLAGAVRAVRRGDAADALRSLDVLKGQRKIHRAWNTKTVPQRWLELQYGVMPLVKDVQGSCELLAERAREPRAGLVRIRARESDNQRNSNKRSLFDGFDLVVEDWARHEAYVRLTYEPDPAFSAMLARWGLTNPAATAFELIPYSLVLDWFLPVGSWLQSLDADTGYIFKGGSATHVTESKRVAWETSTVNYVPPAGVYYGQQSSMRSTAERFWFSRTRYFSSPVPWFPSWREITSPSLKQAANGLSMLVQAFR